MHHAIKHLSEEQLIKIAKKDKNYFIEFQREINLQKTENYNKLKNVYWIISLIVVIMIIIFYLAADRLYFKLSLLSFFISVIALLAGSKILLINKPKISKEASKRSKVFKGMEIEINDKESEVYKTRGKIIILIGFLLFLVSLTLLLIV